MKEKGFPIRVSTRSIFPISFHYQPHNTNFFLFLQLQIPSSLSLYSHFNPLLQPLSLSPKRQTKKWLRRPRKTTPTLRSPKPSSPPAPPPPPPRLPNLLDSSTQPPPPRHRAPPSDPSPSTTNLRRTKRRRRSPNAS